MKDAWGRWGEEDEIGAINLIDAAKVRGAGTLIRQGRVISLAQPLSQKTPVPKHRSGVQHFMNRDGGDYAAGGRQPGGFQFAEDTIVMPLQIGTHIDALCHVWYDDALYNGFSGNTVRSTSGGARCGIDKMPPIVGRGVLVDMVRLKGKPLVDGEPVSKGDLEAALSQTGVTIEPGDVVLIRTGWLERNEGAKEIDFNREPGLDVEGAEWLANAGTAAIGADNFAVEVLPFPEKTVFPVHQRLIRDFGIALMEGLVLEQLAGEAEGAFFFVAAPLPITGGTGSPLTPLAIF
ncbi:MAG: cyclase family protein [Gammaproteobacteria bacterium]|nr:cyclase family protein [Gammaproteobacteria bacterium]